MTNHDKSNARLVGALYFALLTLVFNLIAKYFLFIFKEGVLFPLFSTSLLSLFLGALFGGLFGQRIAAMNKPSHLFAWGVLLAITIIPCYSLGLQIIYYFHNHEMYNNLHQWQDYLVLYGVILLFVVLVAGIWFIPLTGLAAMQFNRRFLPGYNAYLSKQQQKNISK